MNRNIKDEIKYAIDNIMGGTEKLNKTSVLKELEKIDKLRSRPDSASEMSNGTRNNSKN